MQTMRVEIQRASIFLCEILWIEVPNKTKINIKILAKTVSRLKKYAIELFLILKK
jgi:hypothetical protein